MELGKEAIGTPGDGLVKAAGVALRNVGDGDLDVALGAVPPDPERHHLADTGLLPAPWRTAPASGSGGRRPR